MRIRTPYAVSIMLMLRLLSTLTSTGCVASYVQRYGEATALSTLARAIGDDDGAALMASEAARWQRPVQTPSCSMVQFESVVQLRRRVHSKIANNTAMTTKIKQQRVHFQCAFRGWLLQVYNDGREMQCHLR